MRNVSFTEIERPVDNLEIIEVILKSTNERPIINCSKFRQRFLRFWYINDDSQSERTIELVLVKEGSEIPEFISEVDYINTIFLDELGREYHVFYKK